MDMDQYRELVAYRSRQWQDAHATADQRHKDAARQAALRAMCMDGLRAYPDVLADLDVEAAVALLDSNYPSTR